MPKILFITHEGHPREVEFAPGTTLGEFMRSLAPEASEVMLNGWERLTPEEAFASEIPVELLDRVEVMG